MKWCTLLVLALLPLCFGQHYERKLSTTLLPAEKWGQRISLSDGITKKTKITKPNRLQTRPFLPFSDLGASAGPHPRNDGTTKSRIVFDTLPGLGLSFNGLEEGFTTLDELQKQDINRARTESILKGNLGGLHPDEVYYADDDLLIIKGGGFKSVQSYDEPLQQLEENFNQESFELRKPKAPSSSDEYNGNIATIIAPPKHSSYWGRQPSAASQYYPLSLFIPASILASESKTHYSFQPPQTLMPSPQYPLNGYNFRQAPRFNIEGPFVRNQNTLIYPRQGYVTFAQSHFQGNQQQPQFKNANTVLQENRNDARGSQRKKPSAQRPSSVKTNYKYKSKLPKPNVAFNTKKYSDPNDSSTWISLEGDTNVNYREPKPRLNPDAEFLPRSVPRFTENERPRRLRTNQYTSGHPHEAQIKMRPIGVSIQRVKNPRL